MRMHQHRERSLCCKRQPCETLDRQCGGHWTEARGGGEVEELGLNQLVLQRLAGQGEAPEVGRHPPKGNDQGFERRHQRGLIGGQSKVHQRGSRGSPNSSVAIRLSWISAAPEAMPATTARW